MRSPFSQFMQDLLASACSGLRMTGLPVYFIFWTLKGARTDHLNKMLLSCGIVSGAFLFIAYSSSTSLILYTQPWILVWFLVGMRWWRPKPKPEGDKPKPDEPSPPATH